MTVLAILTLVAVAILILDVVTDALPAPVTGLLAVCLGGLSTALSIVALA